MDTQPIRYATARGGHAVAYWQAGRGPHLLTSGLGHTRAASDFELPVFAAFYGRLIERFRVTRFDERQALSETERYDLDDWSDDALAVARAGGVERFALLSVWPGSAMAAAYLAYHAPELVSHLVLWSPGLKAPEPLVALRELQDDYAEFGRELRLFRGGFDEATRDWFRRHEEQRAQVPSATWRANMSSLPGWAQQVAPLLPQLTQPLLAMYRRDALADYGEVTRAFAAAVPDALVVPVEGWGTSIVTDQQDAIVAMIAAFVGSPVVPPAERAMVAAEEAGHALTRRELDVVRLLPTGMTNARIAAELAIAESTVANHVRNILAKTGTANRTEAGAWAVRHGVSGDASGR